MNKKNNNNMTYRFVYSFQKFIYETIKYSYEISRCKIFIKIILKIPQFIIEI